MEQQILIKRVMKLLLKQKQLTFRKAQKALSVSNETLKAILRELVKRKQVKLEDTGDPENPLITLHPLLIEKLRVYQHSRDVKYFFF